jgi:hypothetical protein
MFDAAEVRLADGRYCHFELASCKCVDTYVRVKQNQNQICWRWKKVHLIGSSITEPMGYTWSHLAFRIGPYLAAINRIPTSAMAWFRALPSCTFRGKWQRAGLSIAVVYSSVCLHVVWMPGCLHEAATVQGWPVSVRVLLVAVWRTAGRAVSLSACEGGSVCTRS